MGICLYAIAFDLDNDTLAKTYGVPSCNNAYNDIKDALNEYGFTRQQESVSFGETADAVKTVMAAQALAKKYTWFAASVRDIQMLRIEKNSNLMPAVEMVTSRD